MRELFLYLAQAAFRDPKHPVSEHQIGVEVFGRQKDYDSSTDTIVRVQVSQLRKRLQQYFETTGAEEPWRIDLPRGSYLPVFYRQEGQVETENLTGKHPPGSEKPNSFPAAPAGAVRWLAVALALVSLLCLWLAFGRNSRLVSSGTPPTPTLDYFWRQLFPPTQQVRVVISDANLNMLADIIDRPITLDDYRHRTYPSGLLQKYIPDPRIRALADHLSGTHLTPAQETEVIRLISPLSAHYGFPLVLVYARDFRMLPEDRSNLILLGHKKGNPWVELFEKQMNFRYEYFVGSERLGTIFNQNPLRGEQRSYPVDYGVSGYCVVAHLPKPIGTGNALLIFGTDMTSTEGGGKAVTEEKFLSGFLRRIGVKAGEKIPYFEALLRTKMIVNVTREYELVTFRRY